MQRKEKTHKAKRSAQAPSELGSTGVNRKPVRRSSPRPGEPEKRPLSSREPEVIPDLDMEWLREAASGVDPKEVEAMTDRVFGSVLQRCGWQRNEHGEIEHVGGRE